MGMEKDDAIPETPKAHAIERRHKYECAICKLLDTENKDIKWHVFSECVAVAYGEDDVICDNCLKDIEAVRKKCRQKLDNPMHDVFKDFMPSFVKDMPGLREAFKKLLS
jgi:hypothetical protein